VEEPSLYIIDDGQTILLYHPQNLEPIIPGLLSPEYQFDEQEGDHLEGRLAMILN